jgi:glycosyltransferase involved in cell wall biosynthesis
VRIAFLSFEFPPETAHGGIATYTAQAADLLAERGHEVEVFAGGAATSSFERPSGVKVHTVGCTDNCRFAFPAGLAFALRHAEAPFEVLEAPEYQAEAEFAIRFAPEIPLVIRMHSPAGLLSEINTPRNLRNLKFAEALPQLRMFVGALRKREALPDLKLANPAIVSGRETEMRELAVARESDEVVSPSGALRTYAIDQWQLPENRVAHVPNPFAPSPVMLDVPPVDEAPTVGFFGRLEVRKGIKTLSAAIPRIAQAVPGVRFLFVGKSTPLEGGEDAAEQLQALCAKLGIAAEFPGRQPSESLPGWFGKVRVAVFPSVWENFPYVCLEAMAAARAVVGSNAGGMSDMIEPGKTGLLIAPENSSQLADHVIRLLGDVPLCRTMGQAARESVLARYSAATMGPQIEASYQRAIAHRRQAGPRRQPWMLS